MSCGIKLSGIAVSYSIAGNAAQSTPAVIDKKLKSSLIVLIIVSIAVLIAGGVLLINANTSTNNHSPASVPQPTSALQIPDTTSQPTSAPQAQDTAKTPRGAHPSDILPRLERAYNNQDIYAIAECFEPGVIDIAFAIMEVFGFGSGALKHILPFFSTGLGASGVFDEGQWGLVTLTEVSTQDYGATAMLTFDVHIAYPDGTNGTTTDTIHTVLIDGVWYIATIQLPNQAIAHGDSNTDTQDITSRSTGGDRLIGTWKQTYGEAGWASSNGRSVQFTGYQANIFSPRDTYSISAANDSELYLNVTGLLGGDLEYWVKFIDNDNIELYHPNKTTLAFTFVRIR
jgi:hypothetical protein